MALVRLSLILRTAKANKMPRILSLLFSFLTFFLTTSTEARPVQDSPAQGGSVIMDDRSAEQILSEDYTYVASASRLALSRSNRRVAVLIGNSSYEKAEEVSLENREEQIDPSYSALGHLNAPCSDVKMVAAKLASIGWRKDEIYVLCDLRNEEIYRVISKMITAMPLMPDEKPRLSILYLAGHGMMVDGRNYVFGVDTLLNIPVKSDQAIDIITSGTERNVFEPNEGVDIFHAFSQFEHEDVITSPFLVLVDACRNNPLLKYMNTYVEDAIKSTDPQKVRLMTLIKDRFKYGRPPTRLARGVEFVYATTPRNVTFDVGEQGHSRMAQHISTLIKPETTIRQVLLDVESKMQSDNDNYADQDKQMLDSNGELYAEGDWCFSGCRLPGPIQVANGAYSSGFQASKRANLGPASGPSLSFVAENGKASGLVLANFQLSEPESNAQGVNTPEAASAPLPKKTRPSIFPDQAKRFDTTAPQPVLIDIFWCSGDELAPDRAAMASGLYSELVSTLETGNRRIGRSQVYAVRIRELTSSNNLKARNQRNINALYVEPYATGADENEIALKYILPNHSEVQPRQTDDPSKDYISVFYCKDAFKGIRAPRVYFQIASDEDLPLAYRMMTAVKVTSEDLSIEPRAQAMNKNSEFPMSKYPRNTEVRVSDPSMLERGAQLAKDLEAIVGTPVKVRCTPLCKSATPGRNIEVWIGGGKRAETGIMNAFVPFSEQTARGQVPGSVR